VIGETTAIFDTGTTQMISSPNNIAKLFEAISGAKSAPELGTGLYTGASVVSASLSQINFYLFSSVQLQHVPLY
jgi:hypothetical protein